MLLRALLAILPLTTLPAAACQIPPQECAIPGGGLAHLWGFEGSAVFFHEVEEHNASWTRRTLLVECQSREGLLIREPDIYEPRFDDAYEVISDALHSEEAATLSQIARGIREAGVEVERITLPLDHCGCDLPQMDLPDYFCPDYE